MYVVIVDIVAAMLIAGGIALVARPPTRSQASVEQDGDSGIYARRIAGTMIDAFGLAIGMMVTLFHALSQG